ncbi:SDR family oxidoreductase [Cyanothece sp. BG0011]|uniref:SDR family oxidoreductase n=1 Tax=Cyanothece sp. BG0011 TaxID=2082950 RepID=UPI000D1DF1B5|nr:SDR family oxidoreductase [Cyanothece sp. BG0011]
MTEIRDKIVWLTGASSGIGEALAYQLAANGAKLILSARREQELQRVAQHCQQEYKANVNILSLDLSQSETLITKAQQALNCYGKIDILIHGSGITQRSTATETQIDVERYMMEVNFFGAIALTKFILPQWQQQKSGHLVIISSLVGKFGTPLRSTYAASKHALHGYFDSLRAEIWRDNIKVTLICPGYINTNISLNALTANGQKWNKKDQHQAQGITPEKCAKSIIKAIQTNKAEVYIGKIEILAIYIKRFFPRIFRQLIRNFTPK